MNQRPMVSAERFAERIFEMCEELDSYIVRTDTDEDEYYLNEIREHLRHEMQEAVADIDNNVAEVE